MKMSPFEFDQPSELPHRLDLMRKLSVEEIIEVALRSMRGLVPCQQASVLLFDGERAIATLFVASLHEPIAVDLKAQFPLDASLQIPTQVWQGKIQMVDQLLPPLLQLPPYIQVFQPQPLVSYVTIPLLAQSRLIGALSLITAQRQGFQPEHLERATQTAYLLAISLNQTQALQQAQQEQQKFEQQLTEQRQLATALAEREQQLRLLLQNMPVMIDARNERDHIIVWNRECEAVTGYQANEIIGNSKAVSMLYPEATAFRGKGILSKWVDYRNWELKVACKDGSIKTILYSNLSRQFPIPGWATWGIGVDITERIEAETALHQQMGQERLMVGIAQRIRQSLDLQAILKTTVDEVRQFLRADRVLIQQVAQHRDRPVVMESLQPPWEPIAREDFRQLLGVHEDTVSLLHQGHVVAIADMGQAKLSPGQLQILQRFEVKASLVVPILQGRTLWGLLIVHQCSHSRNWQPTEINLLQNLATQAAVAIQQSELYERVRQLNDTLEAKVEERTAQLKQALNFEATLKRITDKVRDSLDETQILQTAVRELALALAVSSCNAAIYNLEEGLSTVAYEYTTALPSSVGRVVQMSQFPEIYRQLLQGDYFQRCSSLSQAPMGHISILACPIWSDQDVLGDLWLFNQADAAFDESAIRLVQQVANQCAIAIRQARLYQAAQRQVRELERLNQLKNDFLSTVSHELRTPLSSIRMATQLLELSLKQYKELLTEAAHQDLHQRGEQCLEVLKEECDREIELINDILTLQHLEAGNQPLSPVPIDLKNWIPYLLEPFQIQIQDHQQQLQIEIEPDVPPLVTDLFILQRVCTELVMNACKYTPQHESIRVSVQAASNLITLQICNSGIEIPADELPYIFDKFHRVPHDDPWRYGGTGLGLALVKRLVEYVGGIIWATSGNNLTCFIVELPI